MAHLFSPITINGMTLKNRLVLSPLNTSYAARNGETTERLIRYYEERAKGGVGYIIAETSCVAWEGRNSARGLAICEDFHIEGLKKLTDRVHQYGTKIAIQLLHRGRAALPSVTGMPVKLVSWVPGFTPADESSVLSEQEILDIIRKYGEAAARAKKAGFDAVEIHGAHGYLITQFLSPLTNKRTDRWGGSFEKRLTFALEVLKSVREAVGPDFPIGVRLSSIEGVEGGMTLEDSKRIAVALVDAGADLLHISAGIPEADIDIPLSHKPHGWNVDNASAIREAIGRRVPVMGVGRLGLPDLVRSLVADDRLDMVALGRGLLADPYFPQKVAEGRDSEILPCVACNEACAGRTRRALEVRCAFNPRTSFEGIYPYEVAPAPVKKRVVVAGGGLGGMQAALHAAERGHSVILFEKEKELGGLCRVAALPPLKQDLHGITAWFSQAVASQPNIELRLGQKATAEAIAACNADHIIVATGSTPIVPGFCASNPMVHTAESILRGDVQPGRKALVLGGGLIGCETAEFLAEKGCKVTIVEMRPEAAADMHASNKRWLFERLNSYGVKLFVETELKAIHENGDVLVKKPYGEETLQGFDTLVMAVGYCSENSLCRELAQAGMEFSAIGDCAKVGKMIDAIHSAFALADRI
ncbi:MAG: FAD-dependent oxidoreductase [Mailhella sp.]|nr:FAD-dependent oxidoreductase [Mailhella sp.]